MPRNLQRSLTCCGGEMARIGVPSLAGVQFQCAWGYTLPYITEQRSPRIIRPIWPNLRTYVFLTMLKDLGWSKPFIIRFSSLRAIHPCVSLPETPLGCWEPADVVGSQNAIFAHGSPHRSRWVISRTYNTVATLYLEVNSEDTINFLPC